MPGDLSDFVSVSISVADAATTRQGFGTPLIACYHAHYTDKSRSYTSLAGMVSDGFTTGEPAYLAAAAIFSQNPNVGTIKIGTLGTLAQGPEQSVTFTPVAVNSTSYSITGTKLDGTTVTATATSDATATAGEIATAIHTAWNSLTSDWTSTDNTGSLTIANDNTGEYMAFHAYSGSPSEETASLWTRADGTADPGLATDLNAIVASDNDWYGLICPQVHDATTIAAVAAWAESNSKIYGYCTPDTAPLGGTGIANTLASSAYNRTYGIHSTEPGDYPESAWMGLMFSKTPGSATWPFKTLSGVTVQDYTATQITAMEADYLNRYQTVGGTNVTVGGWLASGRFIDTQRGMDWLKAEAQANVFDLLINNDKIPYTASGFGQIENAIRSAFTQGVVNGFLSDDPDNAPTVTMPTVASQSTANKAARTITGITATATVAGAIHSTTMTFTLSL